MEERRHFQLAQVPEQGQRKADNEEKEGRHRNEEDPDQVRGAKTRGVDVVVHKPLVVANGGAKEDVKRGAGNGDVYHHKGCHE